jgi:DNA polymerase-3 subunit beta
MKFIMPTQELNFLLNKIQNVVPLKPSLPILSNVHLEVSQGRLTLTATDLTVGVRCQTEVKVLQEGTTTLPARTFAQLLRELTAPHVQLSTGENQVTEIVANTSTFKIHGLKSTGFPQLPDIAEAVQFRIPQSVLKDLLYRVSFAVAKEDNRFVLTGSLMRIAQGQLTFLSTDGKRLARAHASIPIDSAFSGSYILPMKAIDELSKNLTEEGQAVVYLMQDKIAVEAPPTTIIAKLLTGEFPDVSRVIPEKSEIAITLHREELISLLRQVSLFTTDDNHSVKFTFSDGDLRLSTHQSEKGEGKVSMAVDYRGPKMEIAFNPHFFIDILRHSKEETIVLGITDPHNPGLVAEKESALQDSQSASPLFLQMPMRFE